MQAYISHIKVSSNIRSHTPVACIYDLVLPVPALPVLALLSACLFLQQELHPHLTRAAQEVLTRYYVLQRQDDAGASLRVTVRAFESSVRLAQAHARLLFRRTAIVQDAVVTVVLMETAARSTQPEGSLRLLTSTFPADPDAQYAAQEVQVLRRLGLGHLQRTAEGERQEYAKELRAAATAVAADFAADSPHRHHSNPIPPLPSFSPQPVVDTASTRILPPSPPSPIPMAPAHPGTIAATQASDSFYAAHYFVGERPVLPYAGSEGRLATTERFPASIGPSPTRPARAGLAPVQSARASGFVSTPVGAAAAAFMASKQSQRDFRGAAVSFGHGRPSEAPAIRNGGVHNDPPAMATGVLSAQVINDNSFVGPTQGFIRTMHGMVEYPTQQTGFALPGQANFALPWHESCGDLLSSSQRHSSDRSAHASSGPPASAHPVHAGKAPSAANSISNHRIAPLGQKVNDFPQFPPESMDDGGWDALA